MARPAVPPELAFEDGFFLAKPSTAELARLRFAT
jgi:hypothetical protein